MKNRFIWVVGLIMVLGIGSILGGMALYFGTRVTPVLAAANIQTTLDRNAGILVGAVQSGSPAETAGIVRGDIILKVDGTAITNPNQAEILIQGKKTGDTLTLNVLHGDNTRDVQVTLGDQNGNAYLGISPAITVPLRGAFGDVYKGALNGVSGALVTQVTSGSPAEKAGLKAGDVILKVNDQVLDASHDLATVLGDFKVGDTVTLSVQSKGQTSATDHTATLGDNPNEAGKAYLGVMYRMIGADEPFGPGQFPPNFKNMPNLPFRNLPNGVKSGLFISAITSGSPAEQAGLKVNDVITQVDGQAATTADALANQIQAAKPGDQLTLTVVRSGESAPLTLVVTLAANPDNSGKAYMGVTIGDFSHNFQRRSPTPMPGTTGNNT